jgi:hypothetical protein
MPCGKGRKSLESRICGGNLIVGAVNPILAAGGSISEEKKRLPLKKVVGKFQ